MQASIDLNFLYFMMATITCCGVAPLIAAVTWAKTTGWGACTGTPLTPPICIHLHFNSYTRSADSHCYRANNYDCNRFGNYECNRLGYYDCSSHTGLWSITGVDLLNHFVLLDKDVTSLLHFCPSSQFCTADTQW